MKAPVRWTVTAAHSLESVDLWPTSRVPAKASTSRRRYACGARTETRAELTLTFDAERFLVGIRARHLDDLIGSTLPALEQYRREDLELSEPVRPRIEATSARLVYAPFYWTKTWDAIFVGFVDEWDQSTEWHDVYIANSCRNPHRSGFFGLCLSKGGLVNGLIIQGPHPLLTPAAASRLDHLRRRVTLWPGWRKPAAQ